MKSSLMSTSIFDLFQIVTQARINWHFHCGVGVGWRGRDKVSVQTSTKESLKWIQSNGVRSNRIRSNEKKFLLGISSNEIRLKGKRPNWIRPNGIGSNGVRSNEIWLKEIRSNGKRSNEISQMEWGRMKKGLLG